jgi:uncharacterized protein (TIGR03083 family)
LLVFDEDETLQRVLQIVDQAVGAVRVLLEIRGVATWVTGAVLGQETPYVWSAQPGQALRTSAGRNRSGSVACARARRMSSTSQLVDRTITALRSEHDALAGLVSTFTDDQLAATSGAAEWTVAQALSHLGSGAEIGRAPIARAAGQTVAAEDNQTIWARWDAAAPRAQAEGFLEYDGRWLETVEAFTPEQRSALTVDLGFLPEPVSLATALGMRLNEVANHSWDVRVAVDPHAEVDADSAELLVELLAGPVGFMLGFVAKPAELEGPVSVAIPNVISGAGLVIDDAVEDPHLPWSVTVHTPQSYGVVPAAGGEQVALVVELHRGQGARVRDEQRTEVPDVEHQGTATTPAASSSPAFSLSTAIGRPLVRSGRSRRRVRPPGRGHAGRAW